MRNNAILILEDGSQFLGESIGAHGQAVGEVVFNTAMTGYQEILTDPSYCRQIVTLTYPHIGNVGTNSLDEEAAAIHASALVVRDVPRRHSNFRAQDDLRRYLQRREVVGIADIDTRRLTRILRDKGALRGCVMAGSDIDVDRGRASAKAFPGLAGMDLAEVVSVDTPYAWREGPWQLDGNHHPTPAESTLSSHVVAYDFGIKRNILRLLTASGARVTVVPARTSAEEVMRLEPDGVFLSNGPGDPEPCDYAIAAVGELLAKEIPIFGICLGHQILALAAGARTQKMKFGHHGANHPVQELASGRVLITSQNHGFAVDEASLPESVTPTHRSLFDGSLQGVSIDGRPAFGFQGHPEASPGPHDVQGLFAQFAALMHERGARHA